MELQQALTIFGIILTLTLVLIVIMYSVLSNRIKHQKNINNKCILILKDKHENRYIDELINYKMMNEDFHKRLTEMGIDVSLFVDYGEEWDTMIIQRVIRYALDKAKNETQKQ